MNTEVEINTNADVEFDDADLWAAVEDSVNDAAKEVVDNCSWDAVEDQVHEAAREAVRNDAWDVVYSDVESMIDDMVSNRTDDMSDVDDHLNDLLQQLSARISHGEPLCGLGTSARDAIIAVLRADNEERIPDSPPHTVDSVQVTEALDVQRRLADLERQMRVILAEITNLGERAASLTPNTPSVV